MAKRFNPLAIIIGAPLLTFAGLALYNSPETKDEPKKVYEKREPGAVRPAPLLEYPLQLAPGMQVNIRESEPHFAKNIELKLSREQAAQLAQYAPVYYHIPGVFHEPVQIYPENGMSSATTTFPKPESLEDKTIFFYGTARGAGQKELFRFPLDYRKK